jgi:hypothetical protein
MTIVVYLAQLSIIADLDEISMRTAMEATDDGSVRKMKPGRVLDPA